MHGCINAKLLLSPPKASVQLIDSLNLQLYALCLNLVFILMSMPTAGSPSSDFWAKPIRLFEAKTLHLHFWERGIFLFFFILNICMLSAHKCFCLFPPVWWKKANCFQPSTQFEFVFVSHFVKMFLLLAALPPVNKYKYLRNIEYKYDIV